MKAFIKILVQIGTVASEKIRFEFFYVPDLGPRSRNDLDLQYSFEQTMIGWSPRCYIPSFVKIGPPVLEKKIFEGFLPYMGLAAILVM